MIANSFEDLRVDRSVAPGWDLYTCIRRKAFLVRVDDTTAWIAAVDPTDVTVVDELAHLCKRRNIDVIQISDQLLREAIVRVFSAL